MYGVRAQRKFADISVGNTEWMVRRGGKQRRHEWLVKLVHLLGIELQELFIPDGPSARQNLCCLQNGVFVIFRHPIIVLESRQLGIRRESHGTVGCPMEEGGVISFSVKFRGDAVDAVVGVGGQHKGSLKHGDAGEYRRHGVYALAPCGIGSSGKCSLADKGNQGKG